MKRPQGLSLGLGLGAIVLVAGVLRAWSLAQGMPLVAARPDESEVIIHTAGFPAGDFNPRWFIYPPFYCYVMWAWIELVLGVERLLGAAAPSYTTLLASDLPGVIVRGRALSVVVGTATVGVLYVVGRRIGGRTLGFVAASLLAGMFLHVRDSHGLKPDVPLALAMVLGLWTLARYVAQPTRRRAVVAGLAIGLAASVKYNALVLLVPAWVAGVMASPRRGLARLWPGIDLVVVTVVAAATLLAANPHLLLDFQRARATAALGSFAVFSTRPSAVPPPDASWLEVALGAVRSRAFGYHLAVSLRRGCGLAMALATPLALGLAMRTPRQPMLALSAVCSLVYYLVIGASPVHLARYFTPITPLVALLVAHLVVRGAAASSRPAGQVVVAALLTLALLAEPIASSIAYDRVAGRTDTRVLATRWMAEHLPQGATVLELGSGLFPIADPDLPPGVRRVGIRAGDTDLARQGIGWVLTHWHHQLVDFSRPEPSLVEALLPQLRLEAEFSPYAGTPGGGFEKEDAYYVPFFDFGAVARPGPLIRIFARTS